MDFIHHLQDPINKDIYYLIREDGHVFTFDYETFKWHDITLYNPALDGLKRFRTSQQFDHAMVTTYEERALNYHKEEIKYFDTHKDFKWGEALYYFKKGDEIRARDENKTEYEGKVPYLLVSDEKIIDDSWTRINRLDALFEIGKFREIVKIYYMDVYLDQDGNIRGFDKNGKEYRISKKTGNLNEILDSKGVLPSYKMVNESIFSSFSDVPYFHYAITWLELANMREIDQYLFKAKKELLKDNIILGEDHQFYDNGWHDIYMRDSNLNEYHVEHKGLVPIEKGTIKNNKYKKIDYLEALEYAKFHEQQKAAFESGNHKIMYYDLQLKQNDYYDYLDYYGYAEDGKCYSLDIKDGIFRLKNKDKDEPKDYKHYEYPPLPFQVALYQWQAIAENYFKSYMKKGLKLLDSKKRVCFKYDLDEQFTIYISSSNLQKASLYIIDNKGNEYKCQKESLIKLPKNTISKSYSKITTEEFRRYHRYIFKM